MAAQSGKSIIVRFKDDAGSPAYQTVGGLRTRSIQMGAETVDITNADSTGNWRELLDGVGVRTVTIQGEGVFTDDTAQNEMWDAFSQHEFRDMQFVVPGLGTFTGSFLVSALEFGGEYNREVTFSATFESTGAVTFA
jgi:TP901-1 family phage major tail protein